MSLISYCADFKLLKSSQNMSHFVIYTLLDICDPVILSVRYFTVLCWSWTVKITNYIGAINVNRTYRCRIGYTLFTI